MKLKQFFIEECPRYCLTHRWQAKAYYRAETDSDVMVLWPLHYVVQFYHWIGWKWDVYRHRESWIDRRVKAAINAR